MSDTATSARSLTQRLLRGAAFSGSGFIAAQGMRFISNIILARLLFPEAFGLMALMTVVLTALIMLSDTGVQQSIMQHDRGDEPDFLNTAWTLNAARGVVLWLLACAMAWPAATLYGAPELLAVLPVGGLALIMAGLTPTKVFTAQRHMALGRITAIELGAQATGIVATVSLAWITGSYWALVWGGLVTAFVKLALEWAMISGLRNRAHWDHAAGGQLLRFGGWIALSSACGFLLAQGDRAILGFHLSTEFLGKYNIAWFLASAPTLFAYAMISRLLIPAYRELYTGEAPDTDARIRRLRLGLSVLIALMLAVMAGAGPWLIDLLYDDRYAMSGPMMVVIALVQLSMLVGMTYDQAALAKGNSRRFFMLIALRASVQTTLILIGVFLGGLLGALAGQALAQVLVYPAVVRLAREHQVWDMRHDLLIAALGLAIAAGVLALHGDLIMTLRMT